MDAAATTDRNDERGAIGALEPIAPDDPRRPALQAYIAQIYRRRYGASIERFAQQLVGLRDARRRWCAGLGYTPAAAGALFVEHYLDRPIEQEIAARLGICVRRAQVVEVGNLAASGPGDARRLIVAMTALLHGLGYTWVAFTATRALLNSFLRLGIAPIALAAADPRRLPDGGALWGSYYRHEPRVMTANIVLGHIHLAGRITDHPSAPGQPGA